MKIQINRMGREFTDFTELKRSLEAKYSFPSYCKIEDNKKERASIGFFCKNCGAELQGIWKENTLNLNHTGHSCLGCSEYKRCDSIREILDDKKENVLTTVYRGYNEEKEKLAKLTHCPVCRAELLHKPGYYFADLPYMWKQLDVACRTESDYNRCFQLVDEAEIDQKIKDFVFLCDLPSSSEFSDDLNKISSTPSKLKDYIQHIIKLEMDIYALTKRLKELYAQAVLSDRNVVASKYLPLYERKNDIEAYESQHQELLEKIGQYKANKIGKIFPAKPEPPILATPTFFNKKRVLAENEAAQAKYQDELKKYENQVIRFETEKNHLIADTTYEVEKIKSIVEKLKTDLAQVESCDNSSIISKNLVDKEIEETEILLKKLYECRNNLYGYNIVFEKYRDVVTLSTFYEYLMAGRCSTLDGEDGAYNIYESEIRADKIIGQLSQVIDKLEDIKANQYMIYSQIQTVNENLGHLKDTMDKALTSIQNIENNSAVIAHNTAVTAYYSKVNAELTNALGFMIAFK